MENLSSDELYFIDGGGAKPGPSTLGLAFVHGMGDFIAGFVDRITANLK
jgi:hypothetical protein